MKKKDKRKEKRKVTIFEKMKKALLLLLIQNKFIPGVKGWELRKYIGSKYPYILKLLDKELEDYGLKVKIVFDESIKDAENPTLNDYDKAHIYITSSSPIYYSLKGQFNIEELGCLSACIIYIISKSNNANLQELINFLSSKIPKIKAKGYVEKFKRKGYLKIKDNIVSIGWRTKAEIDLDALVKLLAIYVSK
jgi:hypothetical protein